MLPGKKTKLLHTLLIQKEVETVKNCHLLSKVNLQSQDQIVSHNKFQYSAVTGDGLLS